MNAPDNLGSVQRYAAADSVYSAAAADQAMAMERRRELDRQRVADALADLDASARPDQGGQEGVNPAYVCRERAH